MALNTVKFVKIEDKDNIEGNENKENIEENGEKEEESMEFLKTYNDNVTVIEVKDNNVLMDSDKKIEKVENPISFKEQFINKRVYAVGVSTGISMIGFNLFCSFFVLNNTSENKNQNSIIEYVKRSPVMMTLVIGLISPVLEEFVFRRLIFGYLRKYSAVLAYSFSCLLFTLSHFGFSYHLVHDELIYFPIYLFLSIQLTVAYDIDKCILASIIAHIINNILSIIEIIFIVL
ncbi:hypothetical protein LY90DRAFT_666948 [Neocallimastix californiae]|jgi:membrane protease YdiL (CAAX protease family)|uniref:CAAX prenyl protease 2/Lysostaphin resistance protein A-like domain-containing protein n=1 Tax=Neocallimastix californiae TaxID=1754190 RepID=A0A1Y2EPR4_9FUNG|nr:hypothetical protein LY90DRAFT_666948 [Neocallimastix californiae]|eukprot:ORY72845.1 hypothetical protein LY90DRAFT_666948 [Neocallimastix californiae]